MKLNSGTKQTCISTHENMKNTTGTLASNVVKKHLKLCLFVICHLFFVCFLSMINFKILVELNYVRLYSVYLNPHV